jgi:hypothetical protein
MVVVASGMPATKPEEAKTEEPVEAGEGKVEEQTETTGENVSETAENNEENGNC